MGNFAIRPYRPLDYVDLMVGSTALTFVSPTQAALEYGKHPAFSGFVDGQLAGCAGLVVYWTGVAEAWAVIGNVGREHGLFVTRGVKRGLLDLIRMHGLHRVQAKVMAEFEVGKRWIMWLGFHEEAVLTAYGPKRETLIQYVMFPKETA
jgi:RimJ/RimL family protein N-acetyltransferase